MATDTAPLPPFIRRMLQREFYSHETTDPISLLQTHISYVILTGPYAYKVKKPVNLGFVDFSTLELRHHFCAEEVRLNQRGAPGIYEGVVTIAEHDGGFQLDEEGNAVEYAVKMRQFPQENLLRSLLKDGKLGTDLIEALARAVATFHQSAQTNQRISEFGHWQRLRQVIEDNYRYAEKFIGGPQTQEQFQQTKEFTDRFFADCSELFDRRVSNDHVRECHGDLHLGNICFWEGNILLFDCIEFNEVFRFVDVMQDAAFTTMDLTASGRKDLSWLFLNIYAERTGDWEGIQLLPLYLCRHAFVRAKINSLSSELPELPNELRRSALQTAAAYYRLAWEYGRPRQGGLILVSGLSGSGKSTVARGLAMHIGAIHVRADAVRKHLAGVALDQRGGQGLYTPEMTARTYQKLVALGTLLARSGFTVILDAKYDRHLARSEVIQQASAQRLPIHILHCTAPVGVLRERVRSRRGDISDATPDLLDRQIEQFEPFDASEQAIVDVVDTSTPIDLSSVARSLRLG